MVKFILLNHPRSGSTLMTAALMQHPSIKMFGEVFSNDKDDRRTAFLPFDEIFGFKEKDLPDGALTTEGTRRSVKLARFLVKDYYGDSMDGATFLQEKIFQTPPQEECLAVGFRIFYDHARGSTNALKVWDYLLDNKDVHVIHLRRRNLLEAYLSFHIASLTEKWAQRIWEARSSQPPQVTLEPHACQVFFEKTIGYQDHLLKAFAEHPLLALEYERDIYLQFHDTMEKIQSFLQVPYQTLQAVLQKQAHYTIQDKISNYKELKTYFQATPYKPTFRS
jgi:LPS sulfotransferase NodH